MEATTSPELVACIKEKEALEKKRQLTQDEFSNDMQDASVVQGDSQNQTSELKNALDDFVNTRKEWIELKVQVDTLKRTYKLLQSLSKAVSVKYKGCQAAIAALPKTQPKPGGK